MNPAAYYESLSEELNSLKDRVRYLIEDGHWQTDGEWKESVLRSILRRHLPNSVEVGSGFVVSPDSHSGQIDVLIYESSTPILFREGDLAFVPAQGVLGMVEVKSKIQSPSHLKETLHRLSDKAKFLSDQLSQHDKEPFVGLFSYESGFQNQERILEILAEVANSDPNSNPRNRVVSHVAIGEHSFTRFWVSSPTEDIGTNYCKWHRYNLRKKAFGYFIHNLVLSCSNQQRSGSQDLWFPPEGKEVSLEGTQRLFGLENGGA